MPSEDVVVYDEKGGTVDRAPVVKGNDEAPQSVVSFDFSKPPGTMGGT